MGTDEQRLSRVEALVETVLKKQDTILDSLEKYLADFNTHLQNTAVFNDRLQRAEQGVAKHSEELYGGGQLVYKVNRLLEKDATVTKALWEIAKPILGMLGIGLIVVLGMFAIMFYSLQSILQTLLPSAP